VVNSDKPKGLAKAKLRPERDVLTWRSSWQERRRVIREYRAGIEKHPFADALLLQSAQYWHRYWHNKLLEISGGEFTGLLPGWLPDKITRYEVAAFCASFWSAVAKDVERATVAAVDANQALMRMLDQNPITGEYLNAEVESGEVDLDSAWVDVTIAAIDAYFYYVEVWWPLSMWHIQGTLESELLRESWGHSLPAEVLSRLNTKTGFEGKYGNRLRGALEAIAKAEGKTVDNVLRELIPGEVWGAMREVLPLLREGKITGAELLNELKNRVAREIEHAQLSRGRRAQGEKVSEGPPDKIELLGDEDQLIGEFERRETLQQELNALKGWVEKAKFSEREAQVYELDMRTDHNTAIIARELGIGEDTVRQYRMRYRDKIRKVAAS
jgi:hypothetical protein